MPEPRKTMARRGGPKTKQRGLAAGADWRIVLWDGKGKGRAEVLQGTLDLMVLKTLDIMGPRHGYGIARRIEQISDNALQLNEGTVYASLLRLQPTAPGSPPVGDARKTIGEPSSTPSTAPGRRQAHRPGGRLGTHRRRS